MKTDFLSQKLVNLLPGKRKRTQNGSVNIDCPMCVARGQSRPDTKQRCGVRTFGDGSIAINCFNCAFSTRWSPGSLISKNIRDFLGNLGVNDFEIKKLNFTAWQLAQNLESAPERESAVFIPKFDEVALPKNAKSIKTWADLNCVDSDFVDVVQYAMTRGDHVFENCEFYWTPDVKFGMHRRLLIPFYWGNKIVGWTGRAIDSEAKPRYMTDTPSHFIFNNSNMYKNRKFVILVEGQFDALAIDGISTQGSKISEQQAYWINETGKQIIVLPDRDAAGQKLIDLALHNDWLISFPDWDSDVNDANDAVKKYGQLFTVKSIIDGATNNKLKINLLRKKWYSDVR